MYALSIERVVVLSAVVFWFYYYISLLFSGVLPLFYLLKLMRNNAKSCEEDNKLTLNNLTQRLVIKVIRRGVSDMLYILNVHVTDARP
ncbi:hypothetical protein ED28_09105 [[Pantoea] beijingensis]|uniref:Uncharacterized protein n=1 Tax=[Pantoea] beijingensis TaxID=1324864 RepID=A0A443IE08_9GAMM|nr:hypothetical protein ED28_09105 [[Pantoea] beijingensis]